MTPPSFVLDYATKVGARMESQTQATSRYRFGLFEVDAGSGELRRQGSRVRLQEQPFQILLVLLEHAGEVVTRDELRARLWASDTYVEFDGSLNAALKKLRSALGDSADNPVFIETIPKRGYRFVAPVSRQESEPGGPQTPGLVPQKEEPLAAPPAPSTFWNARRTRTLVFTVAFVTLISALVVSYRVSRSGERNKIASSAAPVKPRTSVAVLGFNNASERAEDAWLSTAVSEMISTELAAGDRLRIVSGEDVAHLRMTTPWTRTGTLGQDTTSRIGAALSGDALVLGSYTTIPSGKSRQLRLDVRLQEAATGNTLIEVAESGKEEDLFRMTSRIGEKLRRSLGISEVSPTEQAGTLASLPVNPEAARLYALGLERLRDYDPLAAQGLLEEAVKADPKFPLSHAWLARAWAQLGFEQKHKEEARLAFNLSANLPQTERMLIEGDYYESLAKHDEAASVYRALFNFYPDSIDYGVQLANTEILAGHSSRVAEIVSRLRKLPPPLSDDPRIDLTEGKSLSNRPAQLALIRRALSKASAQGKRLLYAQARKLECINLVYNEKPEEALGICEDAYQIFWAAGNRLEAADCLRVVGDYQGTQGHMEQAIATYQRSLNMLLQLGEHEKTGAVLNNMAVNYANEGKLDRAEQLYRQAESHFQQAGDKGNESTAMSNIADIMYLRGNLAAAAKTYQQTLDMAASDDPGADAYSEYRLADLELTQGKVKSAHDRALAAVRSVRPNNGDYTMLSGALIVLGEAMLQEGDFKGARQSYEEALLLRQKRGEDNSVAENKVSLAELALEEGHPEKSEPLLREAISAFEIEKADPDASSAYTVLSRTLLLMGKASEAEEAIRHALELNRKLTDPGLRFPAEIQYARVLSAQGKFSSARALLQSAISSAQKLGYYRLECEARLALAETEMQTESAAALRQASTLTSDAHAHGLELIAAKAARLQKHP